MALGLWLAVIVVISVRAALLPYRHTVYPIFSDAARKWVAGENLYDEEPKPTGTVDRYRYSPLVTVAFVPLSLLPDAAGGVAWRLVNLAAFLGGFAWFCREFLRGDRALGRAGLAAVAILLLPLSLASLGNGQANALVIGLLLAALVLLRREQWTLAAFALTVPILLKLYPAAVAMLLLLVYPRQLGWRLAGLLVLGLVLPFLFHRTDYVAAQYGEWFTYLAGEDRSDRALSDCYRDAHLLLRWAGARCSRDTFLAAQLLAAAGAAGLVLLGRVQRVHEAALLRRILDFGCCWMLLFGPATESCTYILLAPTLALAVWEGFVAPRPPATRALLVVSLGLFAASILVTAVPGGRNVGYMLSPLAATLLLAERVASVVRSSGEPGASAAGVCLTPVADAPGSPEECPPYARA